MVTQDLISLVYLIRSSTVVKKWRNF